MKLSPFSVVTSALKMVVTVSVSETSLKMFVSVVATISDSISSLTSVITPVLSVSILFWSRDSSTFLFIMKPLMTVVGADCVDCSSESPDTKAEATILSTCSFSEDSLSTVLKSLESSSSTYITLSKARGPLTLPASTCTISESDLITFLSTSTTIKVVSSTFDENSVVISLSVSSSMIRLCSVVSESIFEANLATISSMSSGKNILEESEDLSLLTGDVVNAGVKESSVVSLESSSSIFLTLNTGEPVVVSTKTA